MSSNFEWQTEDDDRRTQSGWDEPPDPIPSRQGRRIPWRLLAAVTVLMAAVGGIIWWRVDQRIDATMQAFRTDVIASHNLIQRAAAEGDEEVFRSTLSGRAPSWTTGEIELFRQQLFVDRAPLGLTPAEGSLPAILTAPDEEAAADERAAAIEFSPDLTEAIVTVDQPYVVGGAGLGTVGGPADTIVLQQTHVFRRGDTRWLLAAPLAEFWGDWLTYEGESLNLIYPARDQAIAERLAADLDGEIERLCATLEEIDCSADLHLTVRFDTDPAVLAALAEPMGALRRAQEREDILELPTPTLVGLPPADEAQGEPAYRALRDGYARHLLGAVVAQVVSWQCCHDALAFDVLMEYQLAQLGLFEWPITAADHERVLASRLRLSDLTTLLRGGLPADPTDEEMWQLHVAVDFLINGIPGTSAADMQRTLGRSRNFSGFLNRVLTISELDQMAIPTDLDLAWWLYAYGGPLATSDPATVPTDEDLYLSCTAVDGNQSTDISRLLRYRPDAAQWDEMYRLEGFIWMSSLADPATLLMQEFALNSEQWRTNIWRDGAIAPAFVPTDDSYGISFGETDPTGRKLMAYTFNAGTEDVRGLVVDLDDCDEGCATQSVPGRPYWSPDGQWAIYMGDRAGYPENVMLTSNGRNIFLQTEQDPSPQPLALGPGDATVNPRELVELGQGRAPFWIDERTFGYIRRAADDGPDGISEDEIVIATREEPEPRVLLRTSDVYDFLPELFDERAVSLAYVATHPGQPNKLFIVALDQRAQRAYVVLYDMTTRLLETRLDLLYHLNHSLSFSPDGRYLVLTGMDRRESMSSANSGLLLLHDIAANRTFPFMTRLPFFLPSVVFDWTDDSQWLAMAMEDNLLGLVAPDDESVQLLSHGYGSCTSVAWLKK